MNDHQATKLLESEIRVTPQQITVAKGHIVNHFKKDTSAVIRDLLKAVEAAAPDNLTIHLTLDTEDAIKTVGHTISWILAGCEAIWGLISSGILVPASSDLRSLIPPVRCTTVVQGSGHTSGLSLDHLYFPVPYSTLLVPSVTHGKRQTLTDPDLFLHTLNIPGIHKEVEESLREGQCAAFAMNCFWLVLLC